MKSQEENLIVTDTRDVFFSKIYEFAKKDKNLIFLTADMNAKTLENFRVNLPKQYFNLGIAEQNVILVAAGLALTGKKVFVYGITPFIMERCFEQIKIDISYMHLPVTIVGIGTGFSYGVDGPTHYSLDDITLMSTLSNMEIFATNDQSLTETVAKLSYESCNPTYVRLEKGSFKDIHNKCDLSLGHTVIKKGDIPIFSYGKMLYDVISAVDVLESENIGSFEIIDMFKLHPIDKIQINSILKNCSKIIVVEEHLRVGGLGSAMHDIISRDNGIDFLHLCVRDDWNSFYGNQQYMLKSSKLDKDNLVESIRKYVVR